MEVVALWVNRKPNKEFDLQMRFSGGFILVRTHNNFFPIFHKFNPQKVLQNAGEYEHGECERENIMSENCPVKFHNTDDGIFQYINYVIRERGEQSRTGRVVNKVVTGCYHMLFT